MYKILLSDDNESLFEPFKDTAFKMGIDLVCYLDWESAQSHLESIEVNDYIGLVIDGKGWLNADDKKASSKHVTTAVNWLTEQKGNGNLLPTIIYTAYLEDIKEFSVKNEIIISIDDKKTPFEQILQKLLTKHLQDPTNRIRFKYKKVISVFNNDYLPEQTAPMMIDLLSKLDEPYVDKNNFNTIRDIIEEMLRRAAKLDKYFLPVELLHPVQNNRPNLKQSVLYLTGRTIDLTKSGGQGTLKAKSIIMPSHIGWIFSGLVEISNIFSHGNNTAFTNYTYKSTVFGLCEVLLWFKEYCQKMYKI